MVHILMLFARIDLNRMKRRDQVRWIEKIVVQGEHSRQNSELIKCPCPILSNVPMSE
jgi:hypothetical protein